MTRTLPRRCPDSTGAFSLPTATVAPRSGKRTGARLAVAPPLLPDDMPELYGMAVDGGCLAPIIPHGACVALSKSAPIVAGDIVAIWIKPELVRPGRHTIQMKRLLTGIPHHVKFPFREHPQSEITTVLLIEQNQPYQKFAVRCQDIVAIHKAVGVLPGAFGPGDTIDAAALAPFG